MNRKRLIIRGIVVVVAAGAGYFALRGPVLSVAVTEAVRRDVSEYVAEDAKTRLHDEYTIDMPVSGTLERIALDVGAEIKKGDVLARVDPYDLERQIEATDALIEQARARITGVDVSKPKQEELKSAEVRVAESRDSLEMTRKQLEAAQVNLAKAEQNYKRLDALYKQDIASEADYDEAERKYQTLKQDAERLEIAVRAAEKSLELAELSRKELIDSVDDNEYMRQVYLAEIQRLESELGILRDDLSNTDITAPVDSVLLEKYIEDSRVLQAGTPLMRLGEMTTIEIESDILSEEVTRISVGDPVEISGKALGDQTLMGEVTRIYPSGFEKISALGIEQQRVRILIGFDNNQVRLRPGTSVDIRVITQQHENVVAVPERATFKRNGGWAVFKVNNGRAKLTPVTIGLKNDEWAEIIEGVQPGDTIITERKNDLEDGVRIDPAPLNET
ncbi:MAG: efflux RND transporter periplasmic adaptor subunit [Candidatus Hydrogenedentes bacterium]|nr:efflux RND transporter periplasmic adaptor subunit [Candidatus Hydrogenedentota bacterium]